MAGVSSRFSTRRDINELHVKDFPGYSSVAGADNTTAFQAAITEAINGATTGSIPAGRTVVLPPGKTFIDPTTVTYTTSQLAFNLRGAGDYPSSSGSWLCRNPGTGSTNPLLKIDGTAGNTQGQWQWGAEIRDVWFFDPTAQGADGLFIKRSTFMSVNRCGFWGFANGLRFNDSFTNQIVHCKASNCTNACYYLENRSNLNFFLGCGAHQSATGAYIAEGFNNVFQDFDSENHTVCGLTMADGAADVWVRGGFFENNAVMANVSASGARLKMDNVFFVPTGAQVVTIASGATGVFDFCRGYTAQTVSGAGTKTLTNCVNVS